MSNRRNMKDTEKERPAGSQKSGLVGAIVLESTKAPLHVGSANTCPP